MSKTFLALVAASILAASCVGKNSVAARPVIVAPAGPGAGGPPPSSPVVDYGKRAQPLDGSLRTRILGRWTNPVDRLVVEISSLDLVSGRITGEVLPQTGPAAANAHELVGWVSAAPPKENFDGVIPITWSTTLYEYGTLPVWAGFLRGDTITTMHYLVWPNRTYSWDHISTFQETWTRSSTAP